MVIDEKFLVINVKFLVIDFLKNAAVGGILMFELNVENFWKYNV